MKPLFGRFKQPVTFRRIGNLLFRVILTAFVSISADAAFILPASAAQKIIVGGNVDYPPYAFIDEKGDPAGYDVDLTRALAKEMGFEVEIRLGPWRIMRAALEKGEIDLLQGMSYSEGRARIVDFSIPHTLVHHSIYSRSGVPHVGTLEDLAGKPVAFHGLGFIHDYLAERNIAVRAVLSDTPMGALRLLSQGEADYAVVASLPAAYLLRESKISNVELSAGNVVSVRYCYAVRKGNKELLSVVNEGLAVLKENGEYQKIYDRWLGVLEPKGVPWRKIVLYSAIVIGIFFLALSVVLLWTYSLKKQIAIRTVSLEREVAERKRSAEELKEKQELLIQAAKMASLGTLVSGVAHEINNPNALILVNIDILKDYYADTRRIVDEYFERHGDFAVAGISYSRLKDRLPEKFDDIRESARRIKRIVDDMKDFARKSDTGELSETDLNTVVASAVRLVENAIRKATRRFSAEYAADLPCVRGNPQRIEQVVVNIIINACQSLKSVDAGISVRTAFERDRGTVLLEVRDEGEGILPENISHLTDPFFTTKRVKGGTGLGLSVSAGIIKEHKGSMDFESVPGKGTTVMIRFPVPEKE
jgi:polar amino acid transport system substrate-binding protein